MHGRHPHPLILNTSANLLNVVLNFFFIYSTRPGSLFGIDFTIPGTGWGVAGAAVATSIATAVTGLGITWTALFGKKEYKVSLRDGLKPDRQIISRALDWASRPRWSTPPSAQDRLSSPASTLRWAPPRWLRRMSPSPPRA